MLQHSLVQFYLDRLQGPYDDLDQTNDEMLDYIGSMFEDNRDIFDTAALQT